MIAIIFLYVSVATLDESPRLLYDRKKYKDARIALKNVAKYNSVCDYPEEFIFDTEK